MVKQSLKSDAAVRRSMLRIQLKRLCDGLTEERLSLAIQFMQFFHSHSVEQIKMITGPAIAMSDLHPGEKLLPFTCTGCGAKYDKKPNACELCGCFVIVQLGGDGEVTLYEMGRKVS